MFVIDVSEAPEVPLYALNGLGVIAFVPSAEAHRITVQIEITADTDAMVDELMEKSSAKLDYDGVYINVPKYVPPSYATKTTAPYIISSSATRRVGTSLLSAVAAGFLFHADRQSAAVGMVCAASLFATSVAQQPSCVEARLTIAIPAFYKPSFVHLGLVAGPECHEDLQWACASESPCKFGKAGELPGIALVGSGLNAVDLTTANKTIFDLTKFEECRTTKSREGDEHFPVPDVLDLYAFQSFNFSEIRIESFESGVDLAEKESSAFEQSLDPLLLDEEEVLFSIRNSTKGMSLLAGLKSDSVQFGLAQSALSRNRLFQISNEQQVATFAIKDTNILLAPHFIQSINELPKEYTYIPYKQFIADYGTHYFAHGTVGGRLRMLSSFSRAVLAKTVPLKSDQIDCLGVESFVSLGLTSNESVQETGLHQKCLVNNTESFSSLREKVAVFADGGDAAKLGKLQEGIVFSQDQPGALQSDFDLWAKTIPNEPAVLSYKLRSIHSLFDNAVLHGDAVALLDDLDVKRTHLISALRTYYEEETSGARFNATNCPPCDQASSVAVFAPVPPSTQPSCACQCGDNTVLQLDACSSCTAWSGATAHFKSYANTTGTIVPSTTLHVDGDCRFSIADFQGNLPTEPGQSNYWYFSSGTDDLTSFNGLQGAVVPNITAAACIMGTLPDGHTWDSLAGNTNHVALKVREQSVLKVIAVIYRPTKATPTSFVCEQQ